MHISSGKGNLTCFTGFKRHFQHFDQSSFYLFVCFLRNLASKHWTVHILSQLSIHTVKWSVFTLCFQPCFQPCLACYTVYQMKWYVQSLQLLWKMQTIFVITVTSAETKEAICTSYHKSTPDTILKGQIENIID